MAGLRVLTLWLAVVSCSALVVQEQRIHKETAYQYKKLNLPKGDVDPTGKSVLVTGAAGFIGSHVARHCKDMGMNVVALDDMSGGFQTNIPEGVTFVQGDIKDAKLLGKLFEEHKFNYVYHLAAYAAEGLSHFVRSFNYRTNLVGSVELVDHAIKHKVECFVFTSSIAVYGGINDVAQMQNKTGKLTVEGSSTASSSLTEDTKPQPEDPYGVSKYAFEMDLHAAHNLFGMDFVVFRPHNVYGPNQNMFDKYRNVVGIFINQIHHDAPFTVFGDGEQTRAFSYIDDVAPVIARGPTVLKARNEIFNVGAVTPYTINTLSKQVSGLYGKNLKVDHQPARMEVVNAVSNHDKVKKYFNTPEPVGLKDGLKQTIDWYQTQGRWFKPVEFASVEIIEKMPPSWVRKDLKETDVCVGTRVGKDSGLS